MPLNPLSSLHFRNYKRLNPVAGFRGVLSQRMGAITFAFERSSKMPTFHIEERRRTARQERLSSGKAIAVIIGLSLLCWAVLAAIAAALWTAI